VLKSAYNELKTFRGLDGGLGIFFHFAVFLLRIDPRIPNG